MDVLEHYRALFRNSEVVLAEMVGANGAEALITSHNYLLDFDDIKMAIKDRPEAAVLDSAVKEYQFALFALVSGQYRHAFGGLRLFLNSCFLRFNSQHMKSIIECGQKMRKI